LGSIFKNKYMKFMRCLFGRKAAIGKEKEIAENADEQKRQAELAGLQLTIAELQQQQAAMQKLLLSNEKSTQERIIASAEAKLESAFGSLATPLAQLRFQQSMHEAGKEVKLENIFKLFVVIEERLSLAGLHCIHSTNDILPFDSETMSPVRQELVFEKGQEVKIVFPAYMYRNKYLCKAIVDKTE
jgi:transcription antitermination factor NusG